MSDQNLYRFTRLKGSQNWEFWSLRMEAFIVDKGYEEALYPAASYDPKLGTESAYDEYLAIRAIKLNKAATLIRLLIENSPLI